MPLDDEQESIARAVFQSNAKTVSGIVLTVEYPAGSWNNPFDIEKFKESLRSAIAERYNVPELAIHFERPERPSPCLIGKDAPADRPAPVPPNEASGVFFIDQDERTVPNPDIQLGQRPEGSSLT